MTATLILEDLEQISPASFAGIPFVCTRGQVSGGWDLATERRIGVGERAIPVVQRMRTLSLTGWCVGDDARARAAALRAAFDRDADELLSNPWTGLTLARCADWSFAFNSTDVATEGFTATFRPVAFAADPADDSGAPASSEEAIEQLAAAAGGFLDEPAALAEWTASPSLDLPSAPTSEDLIVAGRRIANGEVAPAGVSQQAMAAAGAAVRSSAAGELTTDAYATLDAELILVATRLNSTSVWSLREVLALWTGPLGGGAFAQTREATGETLVIAALDAGAEPATFAARNRAAARSLFITGEVFV